MSTDMTAAFVKVGEQAAEIGQLKSQLARVTAQRNQCAEALVLAEKILSILDASGGPILCSATLGDVRSAIASIHIDRTEVQS